ncbi:hypothetical protein [Marinirhabdus gelatinilytica]|uniref:Lipoprotein n=1 Tax=Marinirhabdus gelatinilytica TaxID=1703343 RepID=A0A370QIK5_9FLAO|nr:hypothetical protein [Marinirhabdus gelatinilytica]RDK88188.1 hypothetical protein C8D94_10157 [Marinirhabdus gelatinilytica]
MKYLSAALLTFLFVSCIPLQIAPNFEGGKVFPPKKFKRQLPFNYVYAFEDPKDANEFYSYMNAKFQIVYDDDTGNIPIEIDDKTYYLTFYEVERSTKTVNLLPMAVDAALGEKGVDPVMENAYESRSGKWYIALTVTDEDLKDALNPLYENHIAILDYANTMRKEYLTTTEYIEVYLRSKPTK